MTDLLKESTQEPIVSALVVVSIPTTFQDLPIEIHFQVAAYLPDHAINVLSNSDKFSKRLRDTYRNVDPREKRNELWNLSYEDISIYRELCSRDLFEATPYPQEALSELNRLIWSASSFYCFCCKESVGPAHFPMKEMLESVNKRTGMSKITDRQCFARITPVQLREKRVVTWDQLREVRAGMGPHNPCVTMLWDFLYTSKWPWTGKTKSVRYTRAPDRLALNRLLPAKYEATAEYHMDLYTPLRFRAANASTITDLVRQNPPYICPHLSLANLLPRLMASKPIDFRPETLAHDPHLTVAELLVQALDRKPWTPDPDLSHRRPDKPLRKIKEQAIGCGFKAGLCRTSVTLQRYRDNKRWSVGWMRDLVRLKVERK